MHGQTPRAPNAASEQNLPHSRHPKSQLTYGCCAGMLSSSYPVPGLQCALILIFVPLDNIISNKHSAVPFGLPSCAPMTQGDLVW